MSTSLRQDFLDELPQFVNSRDCELLSGYLLLEETASGAIVFGEKMYTLLSGDEKCFKTRMKGVSSQDIRTLSLKRSTELLAPGAVLETRRSAFKRVHAGPINMVTETKRFKLAISPRKRNFDCGGHSFPWC